ncbi:hypothetical protein P168DRAFT_286899, partial [Aspergillus campestris IBT 28561]
MKTSTEKKKRKVKKEGEKMVCPRIIFTSPIWISAERHYQMPTLTNPSGRPSCSPAKWRFLTSILAWFHLAFSAFFLLSRERPSSGFRAIAGPPDVHCSFCFL